MVNNNQGVPESPNDGNENLSTNNDVILGTDSDSDEDEHVLLGYEPLPLVPPEDDNESSNSEDDSGVDSMDQQCEHETIPPITRIENDLVRNVWSSPTPAAVDIEMDSDKVDNVKQAMVNITLPPSAIPEWANNIPEDEWKQHLISRLNDLQKKF